MTDNEIKINLCHYDEDNPYNILDLFEDDRPQPRNGCVCDNCFYGRDKLAVQVLETQRELAAERALADRLADALSDIQAKCCDTSIALHPDADAKGCVDDCWEWSEQALAAWKEARNE